MSRVRHKKSAVEKTSRNRKTSGAAAAESVGPKPNAKTVKRIVGAKPKARMDKRPRKAGGGEAAYGKATAQPYRSRDDEAAYGSQVARPLPNDEAASFGAGAGKDESASTRHDWRNRFGEFSSAPDGME